VRALQSRLAQVDLSAARAPLVGLVRRLRQAGVAVSDRRAVKLQRLVAASALLCGRAAARVSDLWVVRHVWDTDTERETLRELVDAALRQHTQAVDDHPAARGDAPPDPEALARELEALAADATNQDPIARAQLRDRVALLRARAAWGRRRTTARVPAAALRRTARQPAVVSFAYAKVDASARASLWALRAQTGLEAHDDPTRRLVARAPQRHLGPGESARAA
jgi:hypothetical protein